MACKYCKDTERQDSLIARDCDGYLTIDPVAEVIDIDLEGGATISFVANYCHVCGADLQAVAEGRD